MTVVEWGEGLVEQLADEHLEVRIDRRDDDVRVAPRWCPRRRAGSSGWRADPAPVAWSRRARPRPRHRHPDARRRAGPLVARRRSRGARRAGRAVRQPARRAADPAVARCSADAGVTLADVGAIVGRRSGPGRSPACGSGVVTAAALGRRRAGSPPSASARWTRSAPAPGTVVTDARRKEVYWAALRGRRARGSTGPAVVRPEERRRRPRRRRHPRSPSGSAPGAARRGDDGGAAPRRRRRSWPTRRPPAPLRRCTCAGPTPRRRRAVKPVRRP